jgi:hypothetical protein
LQQRGIDAVEGLSGPFQIDRVPQHDGSRYQIEAASPVGVSSFSVQ